MRARYVNVSIHEDLAKEIDKHMKESKRGYRSRAELVSDAVRRMLDAKNN
jgi:metal-responsive CopG/Arc/MetJ family transcriptional regulator